jgi:hypothetical protein
VTYLSIVPAPQAAVIYVTNMDPSGVKSRIFLGNKILLLDVNDYLIESIPSEVISTVTVNHVPTNWNEDFLITYFITGTIPPRVKGGVFVRNTATV